MSDKIEDWLLFILVFVFGVGMFVAMQNGFKTLDTSGWTFLGASFVISFLPVIPYLWLIGIIILNVYFIGVKIGR